MLSDEEKILTKKLGYCELEYQQNGYLSVGKFEAIKEAVNLIEKQSKEIEELKDKCKELISALLDSTPNDKIIAEIEEIRKTHAPEDDYAESQIYILQSLLEKE